MVPARLFDAGPLRFFPAPLREPRRAWLAILIGWALSFVGSIFLSFVMQSSVPALGQPSFEIKGAAAVLLLAVFAPIAETLIMAALLSIMTRFVSPAVAVVASAVMWGVAHSLQAAVWGLVIWWPFLIFSTLYVVWRQRGIWAGIGVAATTHSLQNLIPSLFVAFG